VDGIYHVVRAFPDPDIIHNDGDVDPIRDMETINYELRAKDLQQLEKIVEGLESELKRTKDKKKLEEELELMLKVKDMLSKNQHVRDGDWSAKEIEYLNKHLFITSKPVIYLVNIGKEEYIKKQNKYLPAIQAHINQIGGGPMIPYSA
jgi:obg-like ATPase 1